MMRNTYQIRKYLAAAAAAMLCAGLLAGCTRTGSSTQNAAAGTGNTGTNASGNVVAGAGDNAPAGTASSARTEQDGQPAAQTQAGTSAQAGSASGAQNVSGTTTQQTSAAPAGSQTASSNSSGTPAAQNAHSGNEEDDPVLSGKDDFTGKFEKSDDTEKVQITLENDHLLTFVFSTSMISGSAEVTGNKALYRGDDGYTITFDVAEDTLIVTVDGEDAQQSGMNGVYYRDLGDDGTEDWEDDSYYDADETEDDHDGDFDEDYDDEDDEV